MTPDKERYFIVGMDCEKKGYTHILIVLDKDGKEDILPVKGTTKVYGEIRRLNDLNSYVKAVYYLEKNFMTQLKLNMVCYI